MFKNIFSLFKEIKYIKNSLIIKYKILKNKKKNGYNVSLSDFLNIFKTNNIKTNTTKSRFKSQKKNKVYNKSSKSNESNKVKNRPKHNFKHEDILPLICSTALIVSVSYFSSLQAFKISNNISYYNITEENESKIVSMLKSPKTKVFTNKVCIEKDDKIEVEYYFDIVDSLDSYLYKIKINDLTEEIKEEILKSSYFNTKNIKDIAQVNAHTIIEYNNSYIINNSYNIDKNIVSNRTIQSMKTSSEQVFINEYLNNKKFYTSITTIILSIISSILLICIKKIIYKNKGVVSKK